MKLLLRILKPALNFIKKEKVAKPLRLVGILALLFGLLGLIDNYLVDIHPFWHVMILCFCLLSVGIIAIILLENTFFQSNSEGINAFWLIVANVIGVIVFVLVSASVQFFEAELYYAKLYLPCLFCLPLPWFYQVAFKHVKSIPSLSYAPFRIDTLSDIIGTYYFTNAKKRIIWIFEGDYPEFKTSGDYHFRTFSPTNLKVELEKMGDLFKGVLSLHNHNVHPDRPILIQHGEGVFEWELEHCPHILFPRFRKSMDMEGSIRQNELKFRRPLSLSTSISQNRRKNPIQHSTYRVATIYVKRKFIHH